MAKNSLGHSDGSIALYGTGRRLIFSIFKSRLNYSEINSPTLPTTPRTSTIMIMDEKTTDSYGRKKGKSAILEVEEHR